MREMKDSGIEWIGEIPREWSIEKIKNVASTLGSGTTPTSHIEEYYEGDICWIQSGDIYGKHEIFDTAERVSSKAMESISALQIYKADFIVLAMYGSIGSIAISKIDACTNQACCVIKTSENNDLEFMFYWLVSCKNDFLSQAEGGVQQNISQFKIKNQHFIRPSFDEQHSIARFLSRKCSEIELLTENIKKQIETLKQYKQSIITETVTKGLYPNTEMKDSCVEWIGEIPASWSIHPIYYYFEERKNKNSLGLEKNLLSLSYGHIVRKDANLNDGLRPESYNTYNIVEIGDIIIRPTDLQNDKHSLRTGFVNEHGMITSAYITLKAIKPINTAYFHYLLYTFDVMKAFYNMGNGVRQGLNFSEFSQLIVFEPPYFEQDDIVNFLNKECDQIDATIDNRKTQLSALTDYKKSMIYEYVTGKKEAPST